MFYKNCQNKKNVNNAVGDKKDYFHLERLRKQELKVLLL